METRTKITAVAAVVVLAGAVLYVRSSQRGERGERGAGGAGDASAAQSSGDRGADGGAIAAIASGEAPAWDAAARAADDGGGLPVLFGAKWGSQKGQLGRERAQEGNAEGPMSLAFAGDDLLVLDQVNGRVARYGKDGKLRGTSDAPTTVQDVAVGSDGSVAMLDRLGSKVVTVTDPSGKKVGELPLGARAGEAGLLTAVVVDGKNVYVEKEHGALVPIGTTDGRPLDDSAPELAGRPTKDGELLLTAGLASKRDGRAYLNAIDRKSGSLRFARNVAFPRQSLAIVLLDSDAQGRIYLGVAAGEPAQAHVACMDRTDGHVTGRLVLPMSQTPEESFRDFTVSADGTIAFALRTEDGVEVRTTRCP